LKLKYVFLGLSITSSWGNGHATTYRALLKNLAARGHEVTFLERDLPFYRDNRDLAEPPYARTHLYGSVPELIERFDAAIRDADLVVVGSYVPEGARVGEWVLDRVPSRAAFYDIDTPVTLETLARGDAEYVTRKQIALYAMYLSFTGGPTLATLEKTFGSPCARALYCSVDPDLYFDEECDPRWDLGYLGTYSADRQPALERLLLAPARSWSDGRFIVAGAQYPDETAWPANVERRTHLPPHAHRHFYNAQRFTLNVTRAPMLVAGWSPSVRLFEAAACGTPILSDYWPGLESFFVPGRELLVVETSSDAERYLRDLSEAAAVMLGRRAQRRILGEHTAMNRAETLERCTLELLDQRARRARRRPLKPRAGTPTL
jgi:spore maturation protein CgeB